MRSADDLAGSILMHFAGALRVNYRRAETRAPEKNTILTITDDTFHMPLLSNVTIIPC